VPTPYVRLGDLFAWLALAVAFVGLVAAR